MSLIPLAVIAYCVTAACVVEALQWLFVWRTPGFRALKANLTKHLKAVDEAKEGGDGASGAKGLRKKEQRLANWRTEAGKQMAKYNTQAGLVMMFCMLVTFKLMNRLFGEVGPAARLPFEPPPFLQRVTHRGLTGADPRDCSALFIFVLCQGSLRPIIGKLLNLGMGREFMDIMPTLPKGNLFAGLAGEEPAAPKSKRK